MKVKGLLMLVFVLLLGVSATIAQPQRRLAVSGVELFNPLGISIPDMPTIGELLPSDATVNCPGNEPTGNPMQPCPPGSRTELRNFKWKSRYKSLNRLFPDGWFTIVANSNLETDFTGFQWGTFTLVYDTGDTVEGTWQGARYREDNYWVSPLQINGLVTSGVLTKAQLVGRDIIYSYTPIPVVYVGHIDGFLYSPPNNPF